MKTNTSITIDVELFQKFREKLEKLKNTHIYMTQSEAIEMLISKWLKGDNNVE